jgi:hypothetical protein
MQPDQPLHECLQEIALVHLGLTPAQANDCTIKDLLKMQRGMVRRHRLSYDPFLLLYNRGLKKTQMLDIDDLFGIARPKQKADAKQTEQKLRQIESQLNRSSYIKGGNELLHKIEKGL